jgi:hypothetical protein
MSKENPGETSRFIKLNLPEADEDDSSIVPVPLEDFQHHLQAAVAAPPINAIPPRQERTTLQALGLHYIGGGVTARELAQSPTENKDLLDTLEPFLDQQVYFTNHTFREYGLHFTDARTMWKRDGINSQHKLVSLGVWSRWRLSPTKKVQLEVGYTPDAARRSHVGEMCEWTLMPLALINPARKQVVLEKSSLYTQNTVDRLLKLGGEGYVHPNRTDSIERFDLDGKAHNGLLFQFVKYPDESNHYKVSLEANLADVVHKIANPTPKR